MTWKARLLFEKTSCYRQIVAKYNQCIRLANYAARLRGGADIPRLLMRIVEAIAHFIGNLESERHSELADRYSSSALQICKLAATIAVADKDDESHFTVATKALMTKHAPNGEAEDLRLQRLIRLAMKKQSARRKSLLIASFEVIREKSCKVPLKQPIARYMRTWRPLSESTLANPTDPISQLVQIGIADLDPSRILINCEHIFVTIGAQGIVAELLDMPTAGHKILHCDLHEYAIQGLSLDGVYDNFKKRYCDNCPDCSPRPASWQYSDEWQQEENKCHLEYMQRFAIRTGTKALKLDS